MHCVYDLMIHYIFIAAAALSLTSCTVNISQVHTEGEATDIIDTDQSPSNNVETALDANFPGAI